MKMWNWLEFCAKSFYINALLIHLYWTFYENSTENANINNICRINLNLEDKPGINNLA